MSSKPLRIKHVIFDWSGTLYDDHRASFLATRDTLRHFTGHRLSLEDYKTHFTLPVESFYRRYSDTLSFEEIDHYYFNAFEKVLVKGSLFDGVRQTLQLLHQQGIGVSILSTVRQDLLDHLCKRFRITRYLSFIQGSVVDKRDAMKAHLRRVKAHPASTLFIGDMPHDLETARHHRLISGCILNGYSNAATLLAESPRLVWQHQGDWVTFFQRLHAPLPKKKAPPYPVATAGVVIENTKGEIFLTLSHKWNYTYGIPGGKIDFGEHSLDALVREMREETGMTLVNPRLLMVQEIIHPNGFYIPTMHLISLNYAAKTRGARYTLNDEAQSALWIRPDLALKLPLNDPTRPLIERFIKQKTFQH